MAKDKNPTPFWLKWLVLAFILYAGYLHFTGKDSASLGSNADAGGGYVTPRASDVSSAPLTAGVSIANEIEGAGDPATCGQLVNVRVKARRSDGQPVMLGPESQSLRVGVSNPKAPWQEAIAGMKPSGVREAVFTGYTLDEVTRDELKLEKSDTVRVTLTLESVSPSITPGTLGFLAADLENGIGEIARCGRVAELHVTLWKADGTIGYSSRDAGAPLTMTIGASEYFYGLDRTLLNMHAGGVRRSLLPPAYLTSEGGAKDKTLDFPRDRLLVADVQLLNVTDVK